MDAVYRSLKQKFLSLSMSTAELRTHLHQLIDGITDSSVLQAVHTLLSKSASNDWWDELSEESQAKTLESLAQVKRGETIAHKEVMKEMAKKFPQLRF